MGAKRRERESQAGGTRKTCVSKLCLERSVGFDLRIWAREGRVGQGRSARGKEAWQKDVPGESLGPGEGGIISGTGSRVMRKLQR